MRLVVEADPEAAAAAAADLLREGVERALATRGTATVAVSGGSTPASMLRRLGAASLPWSAISVFQVDERVAPPGDPARNLTGLREAFGSGGAASAVVAMPVADVDLDLAADRYAAALVAAAPDGIDVVHLGLGDDGHTASWPPGDPVVESSALVAAVGPYREHRRLTLTPVALGAAHQVVVLVTSADKADALTRLLDGDPTIPATRMPRDERTVVVADAAACARGVSQGR